MFQHLPKAAQMSLSLSALTPPFLLNKFVWEVVPWTFIMVARWSVKTLNLPQKILKQPIFTVLWQEDIQPVSSCIYAENQHGHQKFAAAVFIWLLRSLMS